MSEGSINSKFQFISYKIHKFSCENKLSIDQLLRCPPIHLCNIDLKILEPLYFKKDKTYVSTINLQGEIKDQQNNQIIFKFETEISGLFKVVGRIKPKELEESLVKIQTPSLLLAYLRGGVTSYFASAGFGSIILPLINIHKIAKNQSMNIKVVD